VRVASHPPCDFIDPESSRQARCKKISLGLYFTALAGVPHAYCENIPNIEISLGKAYSETIFWRKGIRSLVVSLPQTSL